MNQRDRNIIKPFGNDKDFAGCSIFGMMSLEGNGLVPKTLFAPSPTCMNEAMA